MVVVEVPLQIHEDVDAVGTDLLGKPVPVPAIHATPAVRSGFHAQADSVALRRAVVADHLEGATVVMLQHRLEEMGDGVGTQVIGNVAYPEPPGPRRHGRWTPDSMAFGTEALVVVRQRLAGSLRFGPSGVQTRGEMVGGHLRIVRAQGHGALVVHHRGVEITRGLERDRKAAERRSRCRIDEDRLAETGDGGIEVGLGLAREAEQVPQSSSGRGRQAFAQQRDCVSETPLGVQRGGRISIRLEPPVEQPMHLVGLEGLIRPPGGAQCHDEPLVCRAMARVGLEQCAQGGHSPLRLGQFEPYLCQGVPGIEPPR